MNAKPCSSFAALLSNLGNGRVDGILIDRYVGAHLIKNLKLSGKLVEHPAKITSDDIYFIFSKLSTTKEVVNQFNEGLTKIRASGEYNTIVSKYLSQ